MGTYRLAPCDFSHCVLLAATNKIKVCISMFWGYILSTGYSPWKHFIWPTDDLPVPPSATLSHKAPLSCIAAKLHFSTNGAAEWVVLEGPNYDASALSLVLLQPQYHFAEYLLAAERWSDLSAKVVLLKG